MKSIGDFANSVSVFTISSSIRIARFAYKLNNEINGERGKKRSENVGNLAEVDEVEKHLSEEFAVLGFGVSLFLDGEHPRDDFFDGGFAFSEYLKRRFLRSHRVFRHLRLHNSFGGGFQNNGSSFSIRFINEKFAFSLFFF